VHKDWKETDGTIASVEERLQTRNGPYYSVVFTYKVDDGYYSGTFTTGESYRTDDTITVLYDPTNPERNNLVERERIWHWAIAAIIFVGAILFFFFGRH
jgi:hypothetical protein